MARSLTRVAALAAAALAAAPALGQTPIPPPARDFVQAAGQSDQYEIAAARTALAQSRNARVRAFAQQMIDDHTRTNAALKQAAAASRLPPPPDTVGGDLQRLLSALQSQTGAEFDKTYARQQALAHQQALTVERDYAGAGDDANLRRAAQAAVPMIQHHLEMAQQLKAALGAP